MLKSGQIDYKLVKGWFNETLPSFPKSNETTLLRLDGDCYDSTMTCLEHLYPLVQKGGLVIIDDYFVWDGCSRAVHDYLSKHQLCDRIEHTQNQVAYIRKM